MPHIWGLGTLSSAMVSIHAWTQGLAGPLLPLGSRPFQGSTFSKISYPPTKECKVYDNPPLPRRGAKPASQILSWDLRFWSWNHLSVFFDFKK